MSLTYSDTTRPEPQPTVPEMIAREAASTPVYARGPVRRGKVRSWMILAPVGALTVAAIGAWALMSPGGETAAPAETAALIEGEGSGTALALDGPAA